MAGTFAFTPTNGTVLTVGTSTLSAVFTPTDSNDYIPATNTVSLTVNRAALNVTANNASRAYGQTNPVFTGTIVGVTNQDNITAAYSTTATTSTPAGPVAITPGLVDPGDRQSNYDVVLNIGTLTVTPAIPVLSWTNPAPILYGTALGSNQLNAMASVPGGFAYTPTNGTVVPAGTNTLSVFFTPTDANDYSSASTNVSLVVLPPPAFQTVGHIGGSLNFTWSTTPGLKYQIQYSTNLSHTNWTALGSATTASNSTLSASEALTNVQMFYRILFVP